MAADGQLIEPQREVRDTSGKFVPGHPFFGHNELARQQLAKRTAIVNATTAEEALEVMEALRQQALEGGKGAAQAAAVWLTYAVGKPEAAMPPDEAMKTFDVQNLNKPYADLSPDQRRARIAYLLARKAAREQSA